MRRLFAWATCALVVLCALPAEAQQPAPEVACKDRRGAKREFNKGRLAYRRGDYEEAIVNWQQSYSLCEEPLIHLNIANAYERLGDLKNAVAGLKMWREQAPTREHAELDARIESLQARIAEQDKKDAEARAEEERRRLEDEARQKTQPEAPKPTAPPARSNTYDIVGWTLVGVGGAAAIAGVILDVVAGSSRPAEEEACTDAAGRLLCRDAQRDDIESSNKLAIAGDVTWIAGAVIAASGATVLILSATGVIGKPKPSTGHALAIPHAIVSEEGFSGAGVLVTTPF